MKEALFRWSIRPGSRWDDGQQHRTRLHRIEPLLHHCWDGSIVEAPHTLGRGFPGRAFSGVVVSVLGGVAQYSFDYGTLMTRSIEGEESDDKKLSGAESKPEQSH